MLFRTDLLPLFVSFAIALQTADLSVNTDENCLDFEGITPGSTTQSYSTPSTTITTFDGITTETAEFHFAGLDSTETSEPASVETNAGYDFVTINAGLPITDTTPSFFGMLLAIVLI